MSLAELPRRHSPLKVGKGIRSVNETADWDLSDSDGNVEVFCLQESKKKNSGLGFVRGDECIF